MCVDTLSVTLTSDKEVQQLNRDFRGKDKPTDVLSFSQLEGDDFSISESLGDIVISLDTTAKQAKEYKCSFDEELLRLLIHGILHLYGYDHVNVSKNKAAKMMRLQRTMIGRLK